MYCISSILSDVVPILVNSSTCSGFTTIKLTPIISFPLPNTQLLFPSKYLHVLSLNYLVHCHSELRRLTQLYAMTVMLRLCMKWIMLMSSPVTLFPFSSVSWVSYSPLQVHIVFTG
jgi:hypothetical protein